MLSIYKYPLSSERCTHSIPHGARVLSVQTQGEQLCLWALVDTDKVHETRTFRVIGTGWDVAGRFLDNFIGTAQQGPYVWHIFEEKEK